MQIHNHKIKILVVDDYPTNANFLATLLKKQGYFPEKASNGRSAINSALASPPDLILLDIMMPDMDGYEVCRRLKSEVQTKDIPIIFISAIAQVAEKVKVFEIGGADYITKPFQIEEILARINHQLTIRKLQKQLKAHNLQLKQEIRKRFYYTLEKRQLMTALKKSELTLDIAQRVAHVGNWEFDVITEEINWSEEVFRIFGLNSHKVKPSYSQLINLIYNEDRENFTTTLNFSIQSGTCCLLKFRVVLPEGKLRYIESRGEPIFNEQKQVVKIFGIILDITEHKRSELALRVANARLQYLLTSNPAVIFSCKAEKNYAMTFISNNVHTVFGYEKEEMIKNTNFWMERIHPEDIERLFAELSQLFTQGYHAHEYRFLHKDGNYHWIYSQLKLINDNEGNPLEIVGYSVDISNRKQAEQELIKKSQREQAIARAIQRIRQTLDINTIFNATTEELRQVIQCDRVLVYRFNDDWSGKAVAESVGSEWISVIITQTDNLGLIEKTIESDECQIKNFDIAESLAQDTYLQKTQGGAYSRGVNYIAVEDIYQANFSSCYIQLLEQFQARAYINVPIFCNNKLWGLLASYQNSAPRQWQTAEINIVIQIGTQLGVALQQAELLAQTQKQSEELQKAVIVAAKANRAKSEFLANMSHELRTPLNAILGFAQMMNRDDSLSSEQQQNVNIINSAGQHLLSLINDILEMSKIEAGKSIFNENSFDLMVMLKSIENMLELKAETKDLELIFEYTTDIPQYIKTDEIKLRQVLINLLGNAIKFTQKGSVKLRVKNQENNQNEQDKLSLFFEIEDTGSGIDDTEIHLLFEPFGQTETGRKSQQGTGLGLAISRKYVQLMGGDINVKSTPGKGSIFTFNIKVSPGKINTISTSQLKTKVIGLAADQPKYRILVVEDVLESRVLLLKLLTSIGFEVLSAENGKEAVALWSRWQPDLIFMDMRMPVMNGYDAIKEIKAQEAQLQNVTSNNSLSLISNHRTVIIALSASAFQEERQAILSTGCDDFMEKPFQEEILLAKISEHLGVRYIYSQEILPSKEPVFDPSIKLKLKKTEAITTTANLLSLLSKMPDSWVTEIHHAAAKGSDDLIFELLKQIPPENADLAMALQNLATDFQFEPIIRLTQKD